MLPFVNEQCQFHNLYGPAEVTIFATCHKITRDELLNTVTLSIGYPLVGYCIYLLDDYHQPVLPGHIGEIFIGGVGVFAGYYSRDDLTSKVLIEINNELCYATGDLARLDIKSGELIFIGRRDFQIKLRGQRIEINEIEKVVMKEFGFVTACVVMKIVHDEQEHLICFVEGPSDKIKEDDLRDRCSSVLPSYMVPSKFIIMEKFPLIINGKIDRAALSSLNLTVETSTFDDQMTPRNEIEKRVYNLWRQILPFKHIPINKSFFILYGSSLSFMKLYNYYQREFVSVPDISKCLQHPTIIEHAQLLSQTMKSTIMNHYQTWTSLNIIEGEASFAQSRILLDEQIRMQRLSEKNLTVYNSPLLFRVSDNSLSIECLRQVLAKITEKHTILRTSLRFDSANGNLMQHIQSNNQFTFSISSIEDKSSIETIFSDESNNRRHFNVEQGQVFRCRIVREQSSVLDENDSDLLCQGDWIIFNFHHAAFDGQSEEIFLNELQQFYRNRESDQKLVVGYIDYSAHERKIDMSSSITYWHEILSDYNFIKSMNLPYDRKPPINDLRTGEGLSIEFNFDSSITEQLIKYASNLNATLYQICLTIYYIFLFKLTGGQRDLIVGFVNANRYRPELENLIGMFANTLPIRIQLDPLDTFQQILTKVSNFLFTSQPHSHVPFQLIIEQSQRYGLNLIQTMFTLDEISIEPIRLDETASITPCSTSHTESIEAPLNTNSMFDLSLALEHTIETHQLHGELTVSSDLFDSTTVINIAEQFQSIVGQFISDTTKITERSICQMSLIKDDESFWREIMFDYDWNHHINLSVPIDKLESDCDYLSSYKYLEDDLTRKFIEYATAHNVSLESLFLTCYYIFLFKLASNETDLCIAMTDMLNNM